MAYGEEVLSLLPLMVLILVGIMPSRREPESRFLANQRWRYRHVIIVSLIMTAGQWISLPGTSTASATRLWALSYGFFGIITIASVWSVVRLNHRQAWRALGLSPTAALYNVLWSLRIAFAVVSALAMIGLLSGAGSMNRRESASATANAAGAPLGDWLAAILVTTLFVPLAEELFFRGLAYGPLLRKWGPIGATIGSAGLWTLTHYSESSWAGLLSVLWVFVIGIVYAEVYRRRESLIPTVTLHVVHNMIAVVVRGGYLSGFAGLAGFSVALWIIAVVWFRMVSRQATITA